MSCELAYHRIQGVKGEYELIKGPFSRWYVYLNGRQNEFPFPRYRLAREFVEIFDELEENRDGTAEK